MVIVNNNSTDNGAAKERKNMFPLPFLVSTIPNVCTMSTMMMATNNTVRIRALRDHEGLMGANQVQTR